MANPYNNSSNKNNNNERALEKSLKTWKIIAVVAIICVAFMAGIIIGNREKNYPQQQEDSGSQVESQSVSQTDSNNISQSDLYSGNTENISNNASADYSLSGNNSAESEPHYDQDSLVILDNETGIPITMGVSGIYTSCLRGSYSDMPYIDRVESLRGTITVGGTFEITDSGSGSNGNSEYIILDVSYGDNTVFAGSHGEVYTSDEFVEIMESFNGLGIELDINEGHLYKAMLIS